jgi:hypothetical protein
MTNTFTPGPTPNTVRAGNGRVLTAPDDWALLPPGDAALTRRVKEAGEHWLVQEKKGRKVFSRGVWAPAATIERIRAELEGERSTEGYAKRKGADTRRRDQAQANYVEDFFGAVLSFLAFHQVHADLAQRLARAVTDHATPVGSGTVARTKRIPVEWRAEAAAIAWMRHRTTAYDSMTIPRVKGKRREVRRLLARRSQELLGRYTPAVREPPIFFVDSQLWFAHFGLPQQPVPLPRVARLEERLRQVVQVALDPLAQHKAMGAGDATRVVARPQDQVIRLREHYQLLSFPGHRKIPSPCATRQPPRRPL